jgi:Transcriptional regulator containing PAS, AAA-type ATPase, and DNA-binding domains
VSSVSCLNRIVLVSDRSDVIGLCRNALGSVYSIQLVDYADFPPFSLDTFPCVLLVDASRPCEPIEAVLTKTRSHNRLIIFVSGAMSRVLSRAPPMCCVPFPCDASLLRRMVEQRAALLPEALLSSSKVCLPEPAEADIAGFEKLTGTSKELRTVKRQLAAVAAENLTVLLLGESGTGKSLAAGLLHRCSRRKNKNYVPVNMASIPDGLVESELFGTVPGAYTGAVKRAGRFAKADGGTLFMDEIAETSANLQSKLLNVLETGFFCNVGSDTEHHADVRFICATNEDLLFLVRTKRFREDLYYRIADYTVIIPPLRERRSDIPEIAGPILTEYGKSLSEEALELLMEYDWPGNVRQLRSCLRRSCILTRSGTIRPENVRF